MVFLLVMKMARNVKWKITKDGEMDVEEGGFLRINSEGSITHISYIDKKRKRKDLPKEMQSTWKNIN